MAAFWDERVSRYRNYQHLEAKFIAREDIDADVSAAPAPPGAIQTCGYELSSRFSIAMFSGTWTVPNLNHSLTPAPPNHFRTFFGLGFLDLHVEMAVSATQAITTLVRVHTGDVLDLPVHPGDAISATLCLQDNQAGTAFYLVANETTRQTVNFSVDTGLSPAVRINAGIGRGNADFPLEPLARFGLVYFDELVAFSTGGTQLLTNGIATPMVETNGTIVADIVKLNDFAFKVVHRGG